MDDLSLVRDHMVLSVVVGSRAYGLATEASDIDRRGVYVAPTPLFWGFAKPPTHVDGPDAERFSWELERFLGLALEANPTVLECLWSPLVEKATSCGEELLALRGAFLSRRAHRTFLRYADGQFRKLAGDLRTRGEPRWKHVMHLLPIEDVVGLRTGAETVDRTWTRDGVEVDLITHDLAKFARLLLRRNGYVLEQLLSPLVVASSPPHEEMVALAPACLTRHHAHHYLGFARTQWGLFERSGELKPLLYTFRVLSTGIHLMRTGEVVADLNRLGHGPAYLPELIAAKREAEHGTPPADGPDRERLAADVAAMTARLEGERDRSPLPERSSAEPALHDLVVRARLGRIRPSGRPPHVNSRWQG